MCPTRKQNYLGCRGAFFQVVSTRGQLYLGGEELKYLLVSTRVQLPGGGGHSTWLSPPGDSLSLRLGEQYHVVCTKGH